MSQKLIAVAVNEDEKQKFKKAVFHLYADGVIPFFTESGFIRHAVNKELKRLKSDARI